MAIFKKLMIGAATAAALGVASLAQAATFTFTETGGGVQMTSSGSIDLSGLVLQVGVDSWGGTGIETNGGPETDIMGNSNGAGGSINMQYAFNAGTDQSAWVGANGPFNSSFFGFSLTSGTQNFTTYDRMNGVRVAGLGVFSGDVVNNIWTPDNTWFSAGSTFASAGLVQGTFTVTDAVSGESLSIVVGDRAAVVPLPATLPMLLAAMGFGFFRFRKQSA